MEKTVTLEAALKRIEKLEKENGGIGVLQKQKIKRTAKT